MTKPISMGASGLSVNKKQQYNKQLNYINSVYNKPHTKLEKTITNLVNRFALKHNMHPPNPTVTTHVIYCVYSKNQTARSPIYIGQTSHTAHHRLKTEIQTSLSYKTIHPSHTTYEKMAHII